MEVKAKDILPLLIPMQVPAVNCLTLLEYFYLHCLREKPSGRARYERSTNQD